ncbi:macrolide export ATP-binding/permease protein MacB [Gottschalkia purinilytica]|uniref:Macrolide export ATP-binding/permease protein MacB n=1 Tax=Gottschalkia purinilytica TaxID=1503 RepID=A0A0L0WDU8_GOTPU|nr:ABC transporter permease [Gottschalkia purinilytica]KNF09616.1 macrolide export ATP-binding/permease protein MacB [Gottschalkia purinilytica]
MNFIECIKVALSSLWGNKMRSFLTMLGIIIGISSVITIVSLGEGSQAQIGVEFEKFGTNRVVLRMHLDKSYTEEDMFSDDDIESIQKAFKNDIKAISPSVSLSDKAINGSKKKNVSLIGVNEQYNNLEQIDITQGRFFIESDNKRNRNVCVIDEKLAENLFKRTEVIGEKIKLGSGKKFTIVGVYKTIPGTLDKISSQFMEEATSMYIPISSMKSLGIEDKYKFVEVNLKNGDTIEKTANDIIRFIERKHRNIGKEYYRYTSAEQQMGMLNNVLGILSGVIGAIAAISLLVGGIGVMNIMLVSVTERTREIGIRKAIGATRKDILFQFLVESMIISSVGGIIGTILGLIFQWIIASALGIPPSVSIATVIIAVLFSTAVGMFFGIYPANKAAKLDPIEALRCE